MGVIGKNCGLYGGSGDVLAPNPDPLVFNVIKAWESGRATAALISYPGCTNYEGLKVCVFNGVTSDQIRSMDSLDPHFSESEISPIARFRPTNEGWRLAIMLAESLGNGG
jgi:hypothetical protein